MWNKIKESKWPYILVSFLMSFLLWSYVVTVDDPPIDRRITNIPVSFTNTGVLTTRNLIISEGDEQTMSLDVAAKSSTLSRLGRNSITLTVDVSKIVEPGHYRLMVDIVYPPTVNTVDITLNTDLDDLYVDFTVAKLETKEIPVFVEFTGSIAEGYQAGKYTVTPDTITISGQRELVNQVASARVVLGQKNLNETYRGDLAFTYVGSDGENVSGIDLHSNVDTVHVIYPIVRYKRIPLRVDILPGGGATADDVDVVFEGFENFDEPYIEVTGPEDELDGLQQIVVGEIDLSDVLTMKKYRFPLKLSSGFENQSGIQDVTVSVTIREDKLAVKQFEVTEINPINVPEGLVPELVTQVRQVTIRGPIEAVERIYAGQLRIVADLEAGNATTVGQFSVPAKVYVDGSDDVGVIGEYNVSIILKEEEEAE